MAAAVHPLNLHTPSLKSRGIEQDRQRLEKRPHALRMLTDFPEPAVVLNEDNRIVMTNPPMASLLEPLEEDFGGRTVSAALSALLASRAGDGAQAAGVGRIEGLQTAFKAIESLEKSTSGVLRVQHEQDDTGLDDPSAELTAFWLFPVRIDGREFKLLALPENASEQRRGMLERLIVDEARLRERLYLKVAAVVR